jgi:hypothetical protein
MTTRPRCGAQTLSGDQCKQFTKDNQERCWQHQGTQCSVCLAYMGGQSSSRKLDCGHEFHIKCLNRWKTSCTGPDPTCPMCRVPFDVPTYRCRLIIERTQDSLRHTSDFNTSNITSIMDGFGIDFRQLIPSNGRFYTDIQFDVDPTEALQEILRELGLPAPPEHFAA